MSGFFAAQWAMWAQLLKACGSTRQPRSVQERGSSNVLTSGGGHMELKQKCLAAIAVMSQNMFAATLTFARPKAVEGLRISIVFPYAMYYIMYCIYGHANRTGNQIQLGLNLNLILL